MLGRSHRVLVAGSINMDIVATVDRHPQRGETVAGDRLGFFPGGKGANQAVAAAKLGTPTSLAARLGNDVFADELELFLRQQHIDLAHTQRTNAAPTGTALIVVDSTSENTIVVFPGANNHLQAEDVTRMTIDAGDVLVSQFEIPLTTILSFFEHGKAHGATTILNPAPAMECPRELLRLVDVLVVNETELALLSSNSNLDPLKDSSLAGAAANLRVHEMQVIVVTLGSAGSLALASERVHRIQGQAIQAVDTTGAGDCFVGALAAEFARGTALDSALHFANIAASLSVQSRGAGPSMPRRASVEAALDSKKE